ncbi:phosphotransferase enzyme family protein [Halobacillus amylolyticus]|uniref:Phosphotransferase n=1 Tax=Halobacillus amylolyticus TaxID=2932259 RepID=A0ABY4H9M8_9BACI|nr:phosphotransferase [Halobacillus amylolyticus]UOR11299.1 phosphotransferase [Halobacillus amylolyticus]
MEQWFEEQFSDHLLNEAGSQFNTDATHAKKLGDFENYVFEVYQNNQPYILRLTHSSHRSKTEVEAELHWINYLHANGINASYVHPSKKDELVAKIPIQQGSFYVCLFDKAPGTRVQSTSPELFEKWGRVTGHMHRVTKEYKAGSSQRKRWDQDDLLDFRHYLNEDTDRQIILSGEALISEIQALPETNDSFGLIHNDLHSGNFFYHQGDLHLFDFDDSTYVYYMSDIAIPMYYSVLTKYGSKDVTTRSQFAKEFLSHFLKGYQKETSVDPFWLNQIPLFLKLRDYTLYTVFHKKFNPEKLPEGEKQLFNQIRSRLIHNEPIVDIDAQDILQK